MNIITENKIKPIHLKRNAIIYIRQSTLMQVRENTESTKQQYNLKGRAVSLGWDAIQVQVIDEDMGLSATSSEKRIGFQKLVAQVSLSHKVVQYFTQNQLLFPKRDYRGLSAGQIYWGALTHGRVLSILHNPVYAGAYAFGKSTQQASKKAYKPNCGNTRRLPISEWEVPIC